VGVHAAALAGVLAVGAVASRLRYEAAQCVRAASCLAFVPLAFEEIGRIVPFVNPDRREHWLRRADQLLFGSDPTRWTGSVEQWPLVTEALQLVYASFYFLPLVLAARLIARRDFRAMEHCALVVVAGFLGSYLGYLLVPARTPYHLYAYPNELRGLWLTPWLRETIDRLEGVKFDCFPSGHSEIALLLAACAWKHDRPAFWAFFGPIGLLLPVSTVYLRYHYAVDVLAAVLWAAATWALVRALGRRWGRGTWGG
jgi:membrane-associated phospholipid phosphatase